MPGLLTALGLPIPKRLMPAAAAAEPPVTWPAGVLDVPAQALADATRVAALVRAASTGLGERGIDFLAPPSRLATPGEHLLHVKPLGSALPWHKLRVRVQGIDPQLAVGTIAPLPAGTPPAQIESALRAAVRRDGAGEIVLAPAPATLTAPGRHPVQVSVQAHGLYLAAGPLTAHVDIERLDPKAVVPAQLTLSVADDVRAKVEAALLREGDGAWSISPDWSTLCAAGAHTVTVALGEGRLHRALPARTFELVVERLPSPVTLSAAQFSEVHDAAHAKKASFLRDTIRALVQRGGAQGEIGMEPAMPGYVDGKVRVWVEPCARHARSADFEVAVEIRSSVNDIVAAADAWFKTTGASLQPPQRQALKVAQAPDAFSFRQHHAAKVSKASAVKDYLDKLAGDAGKPVLTRALLWQALGYNIASGSAWAMVLSRQAPAGPGKQPRGIHVSVSGDSIAVPSSVEGKDGAALFKECLVTGIKNSNFRVHATLEAGEPRPHLYLPNRFVDADGKATAAEKQAMRAALDDFVTTVTNRLATVNWAAYQLPTRAG